MGLFNLFKKKGKKKTFQAIDDNTKPVIPEVDKKFNQPSSNYTDVVFNIATIEQGVISFEERKKTTIPSIRGLYPAEILLIEYCSKGTYPEPKNGYPGFWWYTYGIKDVDKALSSLEERGFIRFATSKKVLNGLTIMQLKEILLNNTQKTTGTKTELIERVSESFSDEDLLKLGVKPKYILTDVGQSELIENEYVPYMHNVQNKTLDDDQFGLTFNVWSINKLLGSKDKSNWRDVVDKQQIKINQEIVDKNAAFMNELKKIDPKGFRKIRDQDKQIAAVNNASEKYTIDKDLETYIAFWEELWINGGLNFEGSRWLFELPDLYIKAKRYDEALSFVDKLKISKPDYVDKSNLYIKRINLLKEKLLKIK